MIEIYNKINTHKVLNKDDIKRFVFNMSIGKIGVDFVKQNDDDFMCYDSSKQKIIINKNAKCVYFEYIFFFSDIQLKNIDSTVNPFFLVDFYNLNIICDLFHELEHVKQLESISKKLTFKSKLIKDNYVFMSFSRQLYDKNHDLYYFEHDASIKSLIKTLNFIEKHCKNLNKAAILEFNRMMSEVIYHAYGNKLQQDRGSVIYDEFNSPISYTKFLSNCFHNEKERKILLICINNLKKASVTQYMKLLNGFELSDETMNLIFNVSSNNTRTTDILKEIKNIDKQKIKTK